jgi:hypothetical protein
VFGKPLELMAGADVIGDPIAVLPALFHLLWRRELCADLTQPLATDTIVTAAHIPARPSNQAVNA